jgi:hypothetical protein
MEKEPYLGSDSKFTVSNRYLNGFLSYAALFSPGECAEIINLAETGPARGAGNIIIRALQGNTGWLVKKLNQVVIQSNRLYYNFDIFAIKELYLLECGPEVLINWHLDIGTDMAATRKITIISYLSGLDEYEGGKINLSLKKDSKEYLPGDKGTVHLIPSFRPYLMEKVSRGNLKIMLAFMHGNSFC